MNVDITIRVFVKPDSNLVYTCSWIKLNGLFYGFLRIFSLKHWCIRAISEAELDSWQITIQFLSFVVDPCKLYMHSSGWGFQLCELVLAWVYAWPCKWRRRSRQEVSLLLSSTLLPSKLKDATQVHVVSFNVLSLSLLIRFDQFNIARLYFYHISIL